METKNTTRENFIKAIDAAESYCVIAKRSTKISYRCELFIEANQALVKQYKKKIKEINDRLKLDYNQKRIDFGVEKDGRLVKTADGNIETSKENAKNLEKLTLEINQKIEEEVDLLMNEEIEVKYFEWTLEIEDIPADIDYITMKSLQGFVFNLKVNPDFID